VREGIKGMLLHLLPLAEANGGFSIKKSLLDD
jgi:hypothetical protein